jgi:hypothetical protein
MRALIGGPLLLVSLPLLSPLIVGTLITRAIHAHRLLVSPANSTKTSGASADSS